MPLTEYQELAASSRGGARLVSAAAGSGKTRVLVERLMRYVDDGYDIDSFLVVTFTRAAAGELRSRILSELNQRIAAAPEDRRLRRQADLCCRADIGTIDSICGRLLRENAHLAGIAPDFKVAEPERADAIRRNVLDRLMDRVYETLSERPDRRALIDSFGAGRDDAVLTELLEKLHAAVQSHPYPVAWLRSRRQALAVDPAADAGETVWGRLLLERTRSQAEYWAGRLEGLLEAMAGPGHEKLNKGYGPSVAATAEGLRSVARAAALGWESVRAQLPVTFPKPYFRGDDPLADSVKAARKSCADVCAGWNRTYAESSRALTEELEATRPAMEALLELTEELESAFAAEKRRQGAVDFSDQEHMVLSLLEDASNGLAQALSRRYTEVLVDEYQDVNACQDRLFAALSDGGKKLFMVGDVKQSIYRFRLADPGIFLRKYSGWPDAAGLRDPSEPGRILLRENFRSRGEILAAANHVFSNIMSPALGELRYDADAALRQGGDFPPGAGGPVILSVLSAAAGDDEDERPDRAAREAEYVARQIRALVDGGAMVTDNGALRPAGYGDIAILLRSNKNAAPRYRAALAKYGVPSVSQQGGGFFRSLEVTVLLSVLSVVDNPRQDVPLIAALRSPLYGFTADELARIRSRDKNSDFYTALVSAAAEDGKCADFLRELEEYRSVADDLSVEALMERICRRRDVYALLAAMPDAEARRENLRALGDCARQFEQDGYRGLFRFLQWIRQLEQRGDEPRTGAAERGEAVQIISIHHSKGLEYPIVFLADTARRFNKSDTGSAVLVHPELGVGGKVTDAARGIRYPSLAWRAIAARMEEETLSEEMRVLYVAMTRAKDRLFISCSWPDADARIRKLREGLASPVSDELLRRDASPGDWLLRAALLPDSPMVLSVDPAQEEAEASPPPAETGQEGPAPARDLSPLLEWRYPMAWAQSLPSKLTASALEGTDPPDPDAKAAFPARPRPARKPEFRGRTALTAAERGSAVHTVMQFIDFARCARPGAVPGEIARLLSEGRLTPAQAEAVDPAPVEAFFRSEIGRRVLAADQVWRELRFSLLVDASELYDVPPGESILLQGVADCCLREGDALTVVDYKTDFVSDDTLAAKAAEYAPQLRSYASALRRILGLPVREGVLFFLRTGQAVNVPLDEK